MYYETYSSYKEIRLLELGQCPKFRASLGSTFCITCAFLDFSAKFIWNDSSTFVRVLQYVSRCFGGQMVRNSLGEAVHYDFLDNIQVSELVSFAPLFSWAINVWKI